MATAIQPRIKPPRLHEPQQAIWHDPSRFIVVDAGRRFGKSRLGALKCTTEGMRGKRFWWIWPNYPNASVGWRMLKRLALQIPGTTAREVETMVLFPSGGFAQVKSADPIPKIIVLGKDGEARAASLAAGADAFVIKGDPPKQLLVAFDQVSSQS